MNAFTPIQLTRQQEMQRKLHALSTAAREASASVDERGDVWDKPAGIALVNAMYELTECDDLYAWARDLEREFAPVEPLCPEVIREDELRDAGEVVNG